MVAKSKTRIPKQKRSEATRSKILSAGLKLFSELGYHSTSSKKIAREAGISVGSFYNYFNDKKELLFEIHKQHADRVHRLVAEQLGSDFVTEREGGQELVKKLVHQVLELHSFSPELHREITALSYTDPDFAKMTQEEEESSVRMLIQLMEPHRDKLRVDDLEAASMVIAHAMESVIHSIKIFGSSIDKTRLLNELGDMLYRYLFV